ncbi:P22AR C-terminal domain-containing protein [Rodentibacter pneumotropicus]|uniref:P22AR C-terminal domain-containing protein n=1 Tax=Rodentibacter pneumotropicus TaxID=758 RepID=UPI00109D5904|nr:P22AR C-terminal domain-containing protein [Rodentibacter pneumotropicus]THA07303.1 phage repressor protein/antirepressor Ant [Rodentibacter pneumotropicus]
MKTVLSTFNFHSFPVRISVVDQEPFFCLLDVATVLGLGNRSVSKFKFNPKGVEKFSTPSNGGDQEMIFINEPNLYRVIFRSNKPEAEKFQNWVFEEVLPQIRKTGKYEHKTTVDDRTGLRNAVNMLVSKKGLIYSEAYNLVHQYMNVESIEDIPADKLQSAVEYVHRIVLEGELIEPKKNEHYSFEFTEHELQQLVWTWFALLRCAEMCRVLYPALRQIGSSYAATVRDLGVEYNYTIRQSQNTLSRITEQFSCEPSSNWRVLKYLRAYNPKKSGFQLDIL